MAATTAPATAGAATPRALTAANSLVVSDGLCVALVPDGWVDDGAGRGSTLGGATFALFGGRLATPEDWTRAADLVVAQAGARSGATVRRTDDLVLVTFADNRGFEGRRRFADRYCDIAVSGSKAVPGSERAFWTAIVDSLTPAP